MMQHYKGVIPPPSLGNIAWVATKWDASGKASEQTIVGVFATDRYPYDDEARRMYLECVTDLDKDPESFKAANDD